MTTTLHTATATLDDDGEMAVTFTCAGDETSPCHQYPDCGCEDECNHPLVPHAECWLTDWFADGDWLDYRGADADAPAYGCPAVPRSGLIDAKYDDGRVAWKWIEVRP